MVLTAMGSMIISSTSSPDRTSSDRSSAVLGNPVSRLVKTLVLVISALKLDCCLHLLHVPWARQLGLPQYLIANVGSYLMNHLSYLGEQLMQQHDSTFAF